MDVMDLYWNAPWAGLSPQFTGALIAAGAVGCASSHRAVSLYDLLCNLDDANTMRAARDGATNLGILNALDDELAFLDAQLTGIQMALVRRFGCIPHDHI